MAGGSYSAEDLEELPEAATAASLGCGNPMALATLPPGEVVLDLGSGGGSDIGCGCRGGTLDIPCHVVIIVNVYEEMKYGGQAEPENTQGNGSDPGTATNPATDLAMMRRALQEAARAAELGEVPVGAVVTRGEEILAVAHNERESTKDPTAHAELLALRRAARKLGTWRLTGCTLYSTLEPCPMCGGALHAARVGRLVYAAPDPKAGAAGTLYDLPADTRLNHTYPSTAGVLQPESAALLRAFFEKRRRKRQAPSEPP